MKDIFKTPRALRIYGISALILCALCITLRVLGIMFFFDSDIGYFQKGSPVSVLAELLPALCVIAALVVWSHRSNIVRLIRGNENKFKFHVGPPQ